MRCHSVLQVGSSANDNNWKIFRDLQRTVSQDFTLVTKRKGFFSYSLDAEQKIFISDFHLRYSPGNAEIGKESTWLHCWHARNELMRTKLWVTNSNSLKGGTNLPELLNLSISFSPQKIVCCFLSYQVILWGFMFPIGTTGWFLNNWLPLQK